MNLNWNFVPGSLVYVAKGRIRNFSGLVIGVPTDAVLKCYVMWNHNGEIKFETEEYFRMRMLEDAYADMYDCDGTLL